MRNLVFVACSAILVGCSSTTPAPNFINGYYFMAGDTNCAKLRSISSTQIECFNAKGQTTGHRDAMTAQEIQMYQAQVIQQQMQMQQMQQSIANNNAMLAANTQATLNAASVYNPPIVQPMQISGQNQVRCIGVGIYANCRW